MRPCLIAIALTATVCLTFPLHAAEPAAKPYAPFVAPASDEGEEAVAQIKVPDGFKVSLFAAEPRLANPVAFYIDDHNRFYVVETFRRKSAVIDTRQVMHWLDDDTASRTVGMRNAMVRKYLTPPEVAAMEVDSERLKRIEDRDGDGKADHDTVFAEGFNRLEDGIAAGALVHGNDVYFTDVPSLWRLRDTDNDGVADQRDELHYGYGVRYAFNGHDLHGLRFGPDGKLYFSMGDRGLHVERTPDGRIVSNPDSGAVLRCNPDGTELELFHTGLRNPQELAFDEYGNLFTGDNNSDAGDKARWVYLVEGGDTGWRIGYQAQEWPVSRGPWNAEGIWMDNPPFPRFYSIPPVIELLASGPSGLTYNPGTGLPENLRGRFLMADFRGGPANSSVWAYLVKPKGAGFEMAEQTPIVRNLLVTDVEVGWDGLYVSDWTNGWLTTGKGRLYRIAHEESLKQPIVSETRKLMNEGMTKRSPEELAKLLGHADQRVRQAAQFELAGRGEASAKTFAGVATGSDHQLARIHAIWGLGQIGRKSPGVLRSVVALLKDKDGEIRTQAMKVLGDAKAADAYDGVLAQLGDASPRVRYFALMALSKLQKPEALPKVAQAIRDNADQDAYLRHAGVMALVGLSDEAGLVAMAKDTSSSLRMAALLGLRRLHSPQVALFLEDKDRNLVLEAARAINDVPILAAMPRLAAMAGRKDLQEPVLVRALNANYRAGTPEAAAALASYAGASDGTELYRVEALRMLGAWETLPGRDRVTGNWRSTETRDPNVAKVAAAKVLPEILRTAPEAVRVVAAGLVTKMGVGEPALLAELSADQKLGPDLRAAAIAALAEAGGDQLAPAVDVAMKDKNVRVRAAAVRALAKLPDGVKRLTAVLNPGENSQGDAGATPREQQAALAALATLPGEEVDRQIGDLLDHMSAGGSQSGHVPAEIRLDVLEAAAARKSETVAEKLKRYEAKRDANDPLAAYAETLAGGDVRAGEQIFRERADVQCLRCHAINKKGGNAGPDLAGLAIRSNRSQILEAIVMPGKVIAPGFESVTVRLKDGKVYSGQVKTEDDKVLQIVDPGKTDVRVDKAQIKSRRGGMSSMPDNIKDTLSKQDVRNLVEFLSTLTDEPRKGRQRKDDAKDKDAHGADDAAGT